jgi:hypothetical protein
VRGRLLVPALAREAAAGTAAVSLGVAGSALLSERAGLHLLGFDLITLQLTVLHFHVAGFAASLVAGETATRWPTRAACFGALAVPTGLFAVMCGFFLGDGAELVGAVILTAGILATSTVALQQAGRLNRPARLLLRGGAAVTPATMALALWWALGNAFDLPHLSLAQTAATHGVANAVAFGVFGIAGWLAAPGPPL